MARRVLEMPAVELLAAIVESSDDAILGTTLDGTILSWNPAAERLYGYSAAEAVGHSLKILLPSDHDDDVERILERVRAGERVDRYETRRRRKDGVEVDISVTVSPIRNGEGRLVGAASIGRDIGERKRLQETYRHLFEQHPSPMWVFDLDTLGFLAVNDAAVAAYGWSREELLAMTIEEIRPPEDRPALLREVNGPDIPRAAGIWRHLHRDGSLVEVAVFSGPVEFEGRAARLVLAQNVTETRRLEGQLLQAQRAEAIGSLAAGVAHDFNNVLMVVRACSALLLKRVRDDAQRREVVQIDEAAERGAELARQLLVFSKQQAVHPELTDVDVVVHQTLGLLERVIGEDVEIELDLAGELPPILVDRGQLGQAIVNLAVNARDAMPDGGTLSLSTRLAGDEVSLCVADTGIGMDERTRERVFDRFFTTKEAGTGLGLPSVHSIVTESGGRIRLSSEPGVGTTFELFFPVAPEARPAGRTEPVEAAQGEETILFVEDEATVRVLVAQTLRSYGYTVVEAEGGAEAIRLALEREHDIDLLLTDLTMPGMSGRELAARLTEERPGLGVVYTSGYPADTLDIEAGSAYVQKPYDSAELAAAVRRVLDAEQAA